MESISFNCVYDKNSDLSLLKLCKLTSLDPSSNISSNQRLNNRSWRIINHRMLLNNPPNHNDKNNSRQGSFTQLRSSEFLNDFSKSNLSDLKPNKSQFMNSRPSLFSHSSNLSLYSRKKSTQTSLESASLQLNTNNPCTTTTTTTKKDFSCENLHKLEENDDENLSDISDISEISEFSDHDDDSEDELEDADAEESDDDDVENKLQNHSNIASTASNIIATNTNTNIPTKNTTSSQVSPNQPLERPPSHFTDDRISPKNIDHTSMSSTKFYIANSPSPNNKEPVDTQPTATTKHRQGSLFSDFKFKEKQEILEKSEEEGYTSTDISEEEDDEDIEDDDDREVNDDDGDFTDTEEEVTEIVESKKSTSRQPSTQESQNDNESDWLSVSTDSVQSNNSSSKFLQSKQHKNKPLSFSKVDPSSSAASISTIPYEQSSNIPTPIKRPKSLLSGMFSTQMTITPIERHISHSNDELHQKPRLQRSSTTGILSADKRLQRPSIVYTRKFPSVTDINVPVSDIVAPQTPLAKQASMVGISDVNISIKPTEENKSWSEEGSASASLLSSSLSKMPRSNSHHSFKNLLSKSSLNLTKLYNASKPRTREGSLFSKKTDNELAKPDHHTANGLKHSPSSLTSSSSILMVSQKSSSTPPPPILPRITTTDTDLKNHDFINNNEELSKSLKESIIIDNKLGKIALPEKVIDAGSFMRRESRFADDDDVFDDYHAKGW
ncbi:hypothetical protein SBY92_003971 [Candida maltosa Xu316]